MLKQFYEALMSDVREGAIREEGDSLSVDVGFLREPASIEFGNVKIEPLEDHEPSCHLVEDWQHPDGHVYPPFTRTEREKFDFKTGERRQEEVPQSERPALLYRLPASHRITVDRPAFADFRAEDAAFLMHLLGHVYRRRLQFADWFVDGRVRVKPYLNAALGSDLPQVFMEHAYGQWRSLGDGHRRLYTNAMFMLGKAHSYEWDWERFTVAYMVVDACWKLSQEIHELPGSNHAERIERMCDHFGLWCDAGLVEQIVELRNQLFHEALWDGGQPTASAREFTWLAGDHLVRLAHRLIVAILGFPTRYIASSWSSLSTPPFDCA